MRKLYVFDFVTLDGYFEGKQKWEIDWHHVDSEFQEFAISQLQSTGMLLFGRVTYEGMAAYWTSPGAMKDDPIVAGMMNSIPKIVFSTTLKEASWNNTKLVKEDVENELRALKAQPGKDVAIFGSGNLVSGLLASDVIDEYRIMVNPVVLGKGNPLFIFSGDRIELKLLSARTFSSGNVLLTYSPVRKG